MYITVDLESMVILEMLILKKIGPSSTILLSEPLLMVIVGSSPLFYTLSVHSSLMEFLMHANICCDICASLVSFGFPLVSST